ncbi:hypothetical protein A3C23_03050 [Candidatus Roizmanbacteria bacterium RIFCSPHIGHO2_02_FULL_37_13b]|uniref:DNA replication and repair protein RecF n=1 Tax=Candidatus Roizmanbacteria bacterium RIFCSPLOWO2_02_FULL_36_11 TaxID=1802071 RepID=A0A1F7JI90_9BACT|nr:MAG: hypothetical protein A3C23_03050 [Candidatus Roizmanbacteria bacterium RIFCSPHIGHO2_02_FULL_37_13b]OGK55328.1 MAG: hypothetical protein A3H78_04485 [Candidatus Roizmanbacteria bacterium RIFCSPLOWO2_02_FULL_36_11]
MILKSIELTNFRNFDKARFNFNPFLTVIVGNNSVGKTNLIEAIHFLLYGSGFRESQRQELFLTNTTQLNVEGLFIQAEENNLFRIILEARNGVIYTSLAINKIKKRLFDYLSYCPIGVIFSPFLIYAIDGQPSDRRELIDKVLTKLDIEYKKHLTSYETALKKRNKLLEKEKNPDKLKDSLTFWDGYLIAEAKYIQEKRSEFVEFYNQHPKLDNKEFSLEYKPNLINHDTLKATFEKQLYIKKTLVGPQRDDFQIYIKKNELNINVHHFGSRSEQRLALFWFIINQIKLIEQTKNTKPILLLDDIFSELDLSNKALILKLITNYQTIVTTTEIHLEEIIDFPHTIIKLKS